MCIWCRQKWKSNQKNKTNKKITLKQKSCVKYPSRNALKENMPFKWHIFFLLLNLLNSPDNVPPFTHQDFLWCAAEMTDRYRIQEFRISPLSPSHRKCPWQSYCLTKHPKLYQPHGLLQNYICADAWYVTSFSPKLQTPQLRIMEGNGDSTSPMETLPVTEHTDIYWSQGKSSTTEECQLAQYFKCCFS